MGGDRVKVTIALALIAIGAGRPAIAAAPVVPTSEERRFAEKEMAYFSQCLVRTNRARVMEFVRLSPNAKEIKNVVRFIAAPKCLSLQAQKMRMKPDLLRWSLFEALFSADFGKSNIPNVGLGPALDFRSEMTFSATDSPAYVEQFVATRQFGDCTVRADPAKAYALLATEVFTVQEQLAVNALKPVLGQCLTGNGSVGFSRTSLRGILAEAMFKLRTVLAASQGAAH